MPARTCQRTSRRKRRLVERAVGGERGDEGGEGAAQERAAGRVAGRCGRSRRSMVGRVMRGLGSGGRRRRRSDEQLVDDGVEGVEAGRARRRAQPVGRGEDARRRRRTGRGRVSRSSIVSPGASKPTRCMPGDAPARIDRRPRALGSACRRPGAGCVGWRDDPPGEVARGPGRPVAPSPGGATRRGTGRSRRAAPKSSDGRLDEPAEQDDPEAEVGGRDRRARRCSPSSGVDRARDPPSQPVVAMTNAPARRRRAPASRLATTASPRDASTTQVGAGEVGGVVAAAPAGRPERRAAGRSAAVGERAPRPRGPAAPSPRMIVSMRVGPRFAGSRDRRAEVVGGQTKSRGHRRGAAAPGASVPWRPRSRRRQCAPSEPQGPCLPAGPPELLLGLVREEAAVHAASLTHIEVVDASISWSALRDRPVGGGTHRACPVTGASSAMVPPPAARGHRGRRAVAGRSVARRVPRCRRRPAAPSRVSAGRRSCSGELPRRLVPRSRRAGGRGRAVRAPQRPRVPDPASALPGRASPTAAGPAAPDRPS